MLQNTFYLTLFYLAEKKKEGESCDTCILKTCGICEEGLECVHSPKSIFVTGKCVKIGKCNGGIENISESHVATLNAW